MLLVADSGSSKTDWLLCDDFGTPRAFQSSGINPFFRTTEDILEELKPIFAAEHFPVSDVCFYGAGIVNEEKAAVIKLAIQELFGDVACEVASDALGAARALCGHEAGISCILGTGSNACFYDGTEIIGGIPPMGYILGDEGSGAVIGRQILGDYFKGAMPESLRAKFYETYKVEKDEVLNRVYRTEKPNKYLASFTRFLKDEDCAYSRDLLSAQFRAFIQRNVMQLEQSKTVPVSFVGSIAFHFQEILKKELELAGLSLGKIVQSPIEPLLAYHRAELLK